MKVVLYVNIVIKLYGELYDGWRYIVQNWMHEVETYWITSRGVWKLAAVSILTDVSGCLADCRTPRDSILTIYKVPSHLDKSPKQQRRGATNVQVVHLLLYLYSVSIDQSWNRTLLLKCGNNIPLFQSQYSYVYPSPSAISDRYRAIPTGIIRAIYWGADYNAHILTLFILWATMLSPPAVYIDLAAMVANWRAVDSQQTYFHYMI